MRSNNPVFNRSEEFNRASSNAYGNQTYAGGGQAYPGYGDTSSDPTTWGTGTPGQVDQGRMTVDSVVQRRPSPSRWSSPPPSPPGGGSVT
jgi:hypothetical protein